MAAKYRIFKDGDKYYYMDGARNRKQRKEVSIEWLKKNSKNVTNLGELMDADPALRDIWREELLKDTDKEIGQEVASTIDEIYKDTPIEEGMGEEFDPNKVTIDTPAAPAPAAPAPAAPAPAAPVPAAPGPTMDQPTTQDKISKIGGQLNRLKPSKPRMGNPGSSMPDMAGARDRAAIEAYRGKLLKEQIENDEQGRRKSKTIGAWADGKAGYGWWDNATDAERAKASAAFTRNAQSSVTPPQNNPDFVPQAPADIQRDADRISGGPSQRANDQVTQILKENVVKGKDVVETAGFNPVAFKQTDEYKEMLKQYSLENPGGETVQEGTIGPHADFNRPARLEEKKAQISEMPDGFGADRMKPEKMRDWAKDILNPPAPETPSEPYVGAENTPKGQPLDRETDYADSIEQSPPRIQELPPQDPFEAPPPGSGFNGESITGRTGPTRGGLVDGEDTSNDKGMYIDGEDTSNDEGFYYDKGFKGEGVSGRTEPGYQTLPGKPPVPGEGPARQTLPGKPPVPGEGPEYQTLPGKPPVPGEGPGYRTLPIKYGEMEFDEDGNVTDNRPKARPIEDFQAPIKYGEIEFDEDGNVTDNRPKARPIEDFQADRSGSGEGGNFSLDTVDQPQTTQYGSPIPFNTPDEPALPQIPSAPAPAPSGPYPNAPEIGNDGTQPVYPDSLQDSPVFNPPSPPTRQQDLETVQGITNKETDPKVMAESYQGLVDADQRAQAAPAAPAVPAAPAAPAAPVSLSEPAPMQRHGTSAASNARPITQAEMYYNSLKESMLAGGRTEEDVRRDFQLNWGKISKMHPAQRDAFVNQYIMKNAASANNANPLTGRQEDIDAYREQQRLGGMSAMDRMADQGFTPEAQSRDTVNRDIMDRTGNLGPRFHTNPKYGNVGNADREYRNWKGTLNPGQLGDHRQAIGAPRNAPNYAEVKRQQILGADMNNPAPQFPQPQMGPGGSSTDVAMSQLNNLSKKEQAKRLGVNPLVNPF